MAIVSRLGVVLGLDSAQFSQGLGVAQTKLTSFASSAVTSRLGVVALGTAMVGAAVNAVQYADEINDTAKANEVAVGTVLKLSEALSVSGGSSENAGKLLASLTNKIDEAAAGNDKGRESFAKLGVSIDDLRRLDEQEIFEKTLKGLAEIPDTITRNAAAMDVFGKAAKNVDIKGVADSYFKNAGKFDDAEKAFKDIGAAIDRLDEMTRRASVGLSTILAPALTSTVELLDDTLFGWDKLTDAIRRHNKEKGIATSDVFKPISKIGDAPVFGEYNLPTEYQAGFQRGNEESEKQLAEEEKRKAKAEAAAQRARDKAKADAEKLRNEIKQQKESLQDQIFAYNAQADAAGRVLSEVEKITLELEQGKKYKHTSPEEKQQLLDAAQKLDYATLYADAEKRRLDYQLQMYEQSKQFEETINNTEILTERLNLEKELAGQSDTQVKKALEYFDLQKRIIALQKQGYSEQEISKYANSEMNRIQAQDENERAQNTFQAGFDKAFNNFVEKAQDSAALGAQAFDSMAQSMTGALDEFARTGKLNFADFTKSVIANLLKIYLQAQATGFFNNLFGGMFGGGADLAPSATSTGIIGMYADGGDPPVGVPSLVGERGAELFVPKTAGTIIPNHSLANMMGNQPQVVYNGPYIANMSTIDSKSFEQRIYQSSSAIWAAHAYAGKSMPTQGGRT
jgi:lambda family phage tail tape measure protein